MIFFIREKLAQFIGHTYRIKLRTADKGLSHISYYRGTAWAAVSQGYDLSKRKSESENMAWSVWEVTRV